MKRFIPLLMLAACGEEAAAPDKIPWVKDYDAGLKQAAAEKKPVMLFFSAPG
jgi:hypothetical protein